MAGLLAIVVYLEIYFSVRVRWLDVLVQNFFHDSFFLLVCCGEECSVEDLDLIFLLGSVLVIPAVHYFLGLSGNILFTVAVVYQDLGGALDLIVNLFPCAAVGEGSPDVHADS